MTDPLTDSILDHFRDLFDYQEWADAQFFRRWKALETAHQEEQILKFTDHIVKVQKFFLHALLNKPLDQSDRDAAQLSIGALIQSCRENHAQLKAYVSRLTPGALSSTLPITAFPGNFTPRIQEILIQIVMHTQHHRAQTLQRLAQFAEKSIIIDWISWIFQGKPAANWD